MTVTSFDVFVGLVMLAAPHRDRSGGEAMGRLMKLKQTARSAELRAP
jgi:hypothetical protein